uniref:S1 motif domain-containing protein n=1 Tax=Eucampia antarctica TaxID=49252 RepID=A0A7S2S0K1_9STRA|mmetsp:Transcript_29307/g.28168  ORF Transcript_29307/g.28168 Transcript_29307/m.28168 type:complete len:412 (+) Transcript_29307:86-1321(+)|eukprot:CAMPEP_0197836056 /NCGR_PEP_ID=MMETSP1437-20131217/27836_1 /TAXON_ID=49252 ORGANISM="Eucampia antarctica, Strain CCMP1452" /NCGR_SAMPLE_ID=MMETSP1437 /ASSEMBLY_ACC=CAM_ASM_001096 /LENGTH=411 /DNA_ID=CAMNT_0043441943 /DNA_START=86 /DNA_END=1321 /DNA_ORIENTATION=+
MKLSGAALVFVATFGNVAAFSPSIVGKAVSTTSLHETVEAIASEPVATPTRFDRLKKNWKGAMPEKVSTENLNFDYSDFDAAVASVSYDFARNSVVSGTVVQFENAGCIVDIGAKASAFLPINEAALVQEQGDSIETLVELDKEMQVQIISEEDENGQLLVSVRRIQYREAWDKVRTLQTTDDVFDATVIAVNRGGAICLVEGLRAFLPGSHLTGQLPTEDIIGQSLPLKFLEVNQEDNKLVVSNRRAVVEQQMADLSRGDIINGMVKALKPYGAFVEVGGMSGLLHISQISYDRIDDLEKVLQPGQQVKCMIIDHDKVNGRIALSTKTLEPEPGDMLRDSAKVFELAEETAAKYHERMEAERKAREESAKSIVVSLGDTLDDLNNDSDADGEDAEDPLASVSDNLDSLLS